MAGMGPLLERLGGDARCLAPDSVGGFGYTDPYAPVPYGLMSRVQHLADFMDALCDDLNTALKTYHDFMTAPKKEKAPAKKVYKGGRDVEKS